MIGLVLEQIVLLSMKNHLYQFGNVVRLQDNTGPTGLDITGLATDVYMIWWDEKFLNRLKELKIHHPRWQIG